MRTKQTLRWLLPFILLIGCGESTPPKDHPLRQLLQKQLTATSQTSKTYQKVITDLQQEADNVETQTITLSADTTSENFELLQNELYYALAHIYNDAPDSNFLSVQQSNDTILASPEDESGSTAYLTMQKILLSRDQQQIRYIESKVAKENWLYDNYIHIKVSFDSIGNYQQHELELLTHIKLVEREIHGFIQGRIQDE